MAKILIIDDDAAVRGLLGKYLEVLGHAADFASDGVEGLAEARRSGPNLILLDIQMPNMDGLALVKELKRDVRLAEVPVLALSSHIVPELRDDMHQAGCDAYLTKPISLNDLKAALAKYL